MKQPILCKRWCIFVWAEHHVEMQRLHIQDLV